MILCLALILTGCSWIPVYRPSIQQGNIIKADQVNQLHRGMSKLEVRQIMGDPILQNTFANNELNYVYTYQPNRKPMTLKRISLTFRNNRLIRIEKELPNTNPKR